MRRGSLATHARWISVFALLLLVCTAAPVLAASPSESPTATTTSPASEESSVAPPDAEDVAKGLAELARKEEEEWPGPHPRVDTHLT